MSQPMSEPWGGRAGDRPIASDPRAVTGRPTAVPVATEYSTTRVGTGAFLGRLLLAQIFLAAGISKVLDWEGSQAYLQGALERFAASNDRLEPLTTLSPTVLTVLLTLAVLVEVLGGLALILGFKTRLAALLLILFLIPTTLLFHSFWTYPPEQQTLQSIMLMKNLAIMGGLFLVVSFGPGRWCVD